jgi:lysozyme family protein
MQHPYQVLQPEYERFLSSVKVTRSQTVSRGVDEIERVLASYEQTSAANNIPAAWIGPTDCRESDCNPRCGIGQGDPWSQVSRHVPAGYGPFTSKAEADKFYLHYDHIDVLAVGVSAWTLAYACWKWEIWNGFGPRAHGRISGYLWSCTDAYDTPTYGGHGLAGKYIADGKWDPDKLDPQPGAVALYLELIRRHPSLAIAADAPLPVVAAGPLVPVLPPPDGVHDAASLQTLLNALGANPPLVVDGNYGRNTRRAVMAFQTANGLDVDGLAGPLTWQKINARLAQ